MAKAADVRPTVTWHSTAGTGTTCVASSHRRHDPDRAVLRTYDPQVRGTEYMS